MRLASALLITTMAAPLTATAAGQEQDIQAGTVKIPKSETPTYHCFVGFFLLPVRMMNEHDDLSSLLKRMGLPEDSNLLKSMMVQIMNELGEERIQSEFGVSPEHAGNPVMYQQEQHRLAKAKVRYHKQLYDSFLDLVENEGEDPARVHDYIISEGRERVQVGITGTGEYADGYKEALLLFEEEGASNPWLE